MYCSVNSEAYMLHVDNSSSFVQKLPLTIASATLIPEQHSLLTFESILEAMLSTRGRTYATLDLAAGYKKERGLLYDRTKHPTGLVSLTNAENACLQQFCIVWNVRADSRDRFSCKRKYLTS